MANHLLFYLLQKLSSISSTFDQLCRPNPKYITDKVEQEIVKQRNKALILIQVFLGAIFIFNIVIGNGLIAPNLQGIAMCLAISFAFFISRSYHYEPFRIFYNISVLFYYPVLMQHSDEGIHGAWAAVQTFPTFVYLFTGSFKHFVFQIFFQTVFLNTFYQDCMEKSVLYMTPDAFVKSMTSHSHQNIIYNITFVTLIHQLLNNAYQHVSVAEKKKNDFENQKNFLLGFSHELRNLINSLMGNVRLASLENITDKAKDLLTNAEVCAELLVHLVNNILDTGKVEIGDLEINPVPTKIYDTMERIWSLCSELIKRKNLGGRMKIHKDIPHNINIDHHRLTQIFLNLVGNAVKFTDGGYIHIDVEFIKSREAITEECFQPYPFNEDDDQDEGVFEKTKALSVLDQNVIFLNYLSKKIDKGFLKHDNNEMKGVLKFTVSDTGCGIPKEDIDRLFHRYTQVTVDQSRRKLGSGLGLFITKQLCQRMNGEIRVFSKLGKGSTFIFCLPVETVANQNVSSFDLELMRRILSLKKLKTLIADNDSDSQEFLKDTFSMIGVNILDVAEDGTKAFQQYITHLAKSDGLNIVTISFDMLHSEAKTAAQKIRAYEREKGLKPCFLIMLCRNYVENDVRECTDGQGKIRANAFLKKPVNIEELYKVVSFHFVGSGEEESGKL